MKEEGRRCCGSGSVGPVSFGPPGSGYFHKKSKKKLDFNCFLTSLLYDFLSLKNDENVLSKSNKQKNLK
jgi:hypothetical protein